MLLSAKERGGQSFVVRVDPAGLAPGVHFARVEARDATDAARGPLSNPNPNPNPTTRRMPRAAVRARVRVRNAEG